MIEYDKWEAEAQRRGWNVPVNSSLPKQAWIDYWKACDHYQKQKAAGVADPGRPVTPHRSGGGR